MFNQRTKSIRIKPDPAAPTTVTSPVADPKATGSASKGLLSFNTSNFTKLFKNSSNFVQTTFGGAVGTASTSNGVTQLSSPEQSFTIPTYKKPSNSSNHSTAKKDILSTPVLIAPTVTSASGSTLVSSLSASSTPAVSLNPSSLSNGNVAATFVQFRSASLDIKSATANSHKFPSSPITTPASGSNYRNTLSSDPPSKKNYNNLFETVSAGKGTPSPSPSSSIAKQHHKLDTSVAASHHRRNDNADYYVENKENRIGPIATTTVAAKSNEFACQKQLDNSTNLSRLKNGNVSANDPAPKPSAIGTEVLLPHETTKNATMLVDMYGVAVMPPDNDASGKILNAYPATNGSGATYNNGSSPSSSSSSSSNSNNNLDFNVQECMDQMLAADSPFDKLNYLQQMNNNPSSSYDAYKISANSHKSMENIYENCVRMPSKQSDDNRGAESAASNYYQQDSNENIIASKSNGVASVSAASTSIANNNKNNANTISTTATNSAQKSNNNNISNASNYNQIFFVANTTELHDIQEIDDDEDNADADYDPRNDDENAFVSRYCGNWSLAKNPALAKHHKNYVPPATMSSASFAAAAAAMNDFQTTNRNPFLQLMETPASTSSAGTSIFFNGRSPCDDIVASASSTTTTNSNINNAGLGINEPIKLFDSLASLAIVAASMTRENGENDAIDACLGNLLAPEMRMANGHASHSSSTPTNDTSIVPADAMKTLRLLLKERDGNNYIKQFLQVISRQIVGKQCNRCVCVGCAFYILTVLLPSNASNGAYSTVHLHGGEMDEQGK